MAELAIRLALLLIFFHLEGVGPSDDIVHISVDHPHKSQGRDLCHLRINRKEVAPRRSFGLLVRYWVSSPYSMQLEVTFFNQKERLIA